VHIPTHTCTNKLPNNATLDSDHPCNALNGRIVCLTGVCDISGGVNGACGLPAQSPCTAPVAPATLPSIDTRCRSDTCSFNGLCLPTPSSCNVDLDCPVGDSCQLATHTCATIFCNTDLDCPSNQWCVFASHACVAQLPNNASLDANHICNPVNGARVCLSGVCDVIDNKCGYANGDGPCVTGKLGCFFSDDDG
jgi:hypothetical protein